MTFLLENKYQSFLQLGSIIFTGHSQASGKYQNNKGIQASLLYKDFEAKKE